jgi:hypothetical protein
MRPAIIAVPDIIAATRSVTASAYRKDIIQPPPVPVFYTDPKSVGDIVDHCVARALDCFGIDVSDLKRGGRCWDLFLNEALAILWQNGRTGD